MDKPNEPVILNPDKKTEYGEEFSKLWKKTIIGQPRGMEAMVQMLERLRSPRRKRDKPIGSVILLGPSGVGKTTTAEVVAEYLFKKKHSFLKISGQNYIEEHRVSELLGSPPGYIGFIKPDDSPGERSRSPYPFLSAWNVFKYDYLRILGEKAKEAAKKKKVPQMQMPSFRDRVEELQGKIYFSNLEEGRWEERFRTLCYMKRVAEEDSQKFVSLMESEIAKKEGSLFENEAEKKALVELYKLCEKYYITSYPLIHLKLQEVSEKLRALYQNNGKLFDELRELAEMEGDAPEPEEKSEDEPLEFEQMLPWLHGVVLIDEVEKAHPSFHNALFEIMDRGRIRLANGEEVDLTNVIFIMTSNVGMDEIARAVSGRGTLGFGIDGPKDDREQLIYVSAKNAYEKKFPAPFRSRMTKVVVYRPFDLKEIEKIVRKQLYLFMRESLPVGLNIGEGIVPFIAKESFDHPEEGARLVDKKLEQQVFDKINRMRDIGEIKDFDTVSIRLNASNEHPEQKEIVFVRVNNLAELSKSEKDTWIRTRRKMIDEGLEKLADIDK